MSPARESLRRARLHLLGAAACMAGVSGIGCRSVSNPANAPAVGSIGGLAAGGLIGSASGHAGSGAFIGAILGRAGGEIARNESGSYERPADDRTLLRELPAVLRSADRFDAALPKDYQRLARRRATSPVLETPSVRAEARQKVSEIDIWTKLLRQCDKTLTRAISNATRQGSPDLHNLLKHRNQVRSRLASLKQHRSWFQSLAS
jgi:hypothetical protein